nr:hypothetical protein [Kibdelosporangium sp. MJ126-NF4]
MAAPLLLGELRGGAVTQDVFGGGEVGQAAANGFEDGDLVWIVAPGDLVAAELAQGARDRRWVEGPG